MPTVASGQSRVIVLAAIAIAANLVAAVGYLALHGATGGAVRRAPMALPEPSPAAVAVVLRRRSHAVLTHDRAAFLATVDPSDRALRARQEAMFDNLAKVPLASWRETLAGTRPAVVAADGWTARLRLSYRLRGFDRGPIVAYRYLTFDRRQRVGWVVSGDGTAHGLRGDPQIWDGGVLTVVRGRHSLVLGADGQGIDGGKRVAELRDVARRLDAGVRAVSAVVGDRWSRRVVALAPATEQQAGDLIGNVRNIGDIAALATVIGEGAATNGGGDRVVIAPRAFDRLTGLGRRVVLTHELVHVAMGGARDARTPMWLVEGLADYVGYKGTGVSARSAARELTAVIRSAGLPHAPPGRDDFAGSGDRLSAAYEEAWLACRMIAERHGERTLVRLYRTAQSEPGDADDPRIEGRALRAVLGVGPAEFAARWRAYVRKVLK